MADAIEDDTSLKEMERLLAVQKAAFIRNGPPSVAERTKRLDTAIALLLDNADAIAAAISEDFGWRPTQFSKFADLAFTVDALKNARSNCRGWMASEKRSVEFPLNWAGATNTLEFQPKGVVGIIAPWNYPVGLCFGPAAGAFAAGNSVILKPSDLTPKTSALVAALVRATFDEAVCGVCVGGAATAAAFSGLAFDHLVYTGSTAVAKHVARAAAANLTPLTLELGGKCPVLIGASADLAITAMRVAHGKVMNAGQTCVAPDYVFLPVAMRDAFADAFEGAVETMYPEGVVASDDYCSIVNDRHRDRVAALIADAAAKNAEIRVCGGGKPDAAAVRPRRIAPTLVFDPAEDASICGEEIFGPALIVKTYESIDDAVAYVNAHPRPLALYYFGADRREEAKVLKRTVSGGVTINDVVMHVAQEDLPFGGVGHSGYGNYHGKEGFKEFSNWRGIHHQVAPSRQGLIKGIYPPFPTDGSGMLDFILKQKMTPAKKDGWCTIA